MPVDAIRVFAPALPQRRGGAFVLGVTHQGCKQYIAGFRGVRLVQLTTDLVLGKKTRLHLEQRRYQNDELRCRLEVELTRVGQAHHVFCDDARDTDLPQVDLILEYESDEQVERPNEDVEIDVQVHRRGDGGASGKPATHS